MGMNLNVMAKLLSCAKNDDIITVKGDYVSDTATFMFESPTGDKISEFEIKLMDIASEHLRIPEVECHAAVRMPSAEFAKICEELSIIGNNGIFCVLSLQGFMPEESTAILMPEPEPEPVSFTFAMPYMNSFTKATPLSDQVTIRLLNKRLVMVEYKIAEMGYVRLYLAPKIEEVEGDVGLILSGL
ncbi:hypothetical protein PIB30_097889 [Stylosanthes scabra]|uniref:DNA sliding clamp PCNA n=1 Tax=Stylosanthes scabra TaxID=79078 RepID=A0ABU6SWV9_9FABA|nr:hypothetical protein [Stylosanthes scabra]